MMMRKPRAKRRAIQRRGGGYSAGKRPISELKPPPRGPGAGSRPRPPDETPRSDEPSTDEDR